MKMMMAQTTMMIIMWMMMHMMKFKSKSNPKLLSPFECGFNSTLSKMPLSIQFTLLVFIFLLFDLELSILISANWKINTLNKNWIMMMFTFLASITISIMYEMSKKSFKWN